MKITPFQGILIGIFSLGAAIGLFVFASYKGSSGTGAVGTVTVWGTLPEADIAATLTLLGQTDTTLKGVTYVEKNPNTIATDVASAIATGVSPDLVLASQEQFSKLAKYLLPIPFGTLSQSTFTSNFVQGAGIFTGIDGYLGIPFLVDPLVLFSNHTILSSVGIARPPGSWEALTGLVPNTAVLTPNKQIKRGLIALGTYDNVHDARGILSTLFFQTGVPISSSAVNGVIAANLGVSTPNGVPPGLSVINFYTQFADPTKVSYTWNASLPDSQQAFQNGDLTLYLGYVSEARYLRSANPNLNFSVTPVPQPLTASAKNTYGLIYAFMIPRGAKNADGAYQLATKLSLSNVNAQSIAANTTGLAPANLSVLGTTPADPIAAVSYSEALYTTGWLSPAPGDTDAVFSSMIGNVTSGRSSVEAALASAERTLSALLQQL